MTRLIATLLIATLIASPATARACDTLETATAQSSCVAGVRWGQAAGVWLARSLALETTADARSWRLERPLWVARTERLTQLVTVREEQLRYSELAVAKYQEALAISDKQMAAQVAQTKAAEARAAAASAWYWSPWLWALVGVVVGLAGAVGVGVAVSR